VEKFLSLIVLSTSLETILSLLSLQKFSEGLSVLILFLLRFSERLLILFLLRFSERLLILFLLKISEKLLILFLFPKIL